MIKKQQKNEIQSDFVVEVPRFGFFSMLYGRFLKFDLNYARIIQKGVSIMIFIKDSCDSA